jgi:serine/threonine protein kinase
MAPEIITCATHSSKGDIFSVFVILFQMATREVPTAAKSQYELLQEYNARLRGKTEISSDSRLNQVDADLKDLIERLGKLSPEERPTTTQALSHPFFDRIFLHE